MANNSNLDRPLDLNNFRDTGGLTTQKLTLGLWIVAHRKLFVSGVVLFLIGISAIFYGYTIYSYIDYFFIGGVREKQIIEELTTTPGVEESQRNKNLAQKLEETEPAFFINNSKYDFLEVLSNPNDKFYATFDFCFLDGAAEVACGKSNIMPLETKYVVSLAHELKSRPGSLKFKIKDIIWQRLNLHNYPNWKEFAANHLSFAVSDVQFKSSQASGLSEKLNINTLDFKITNNTAYNYWDVPLNVLLYANQRPVAAQRYVISEFKSAEYRFVRLSWADSISQIDEARVIPDLNLLDDTIFMKYQ